MHTLSEQAMIAIWERGLNQHAVERALIILAAALPEMSGDDLLALSLGQRDAHLLAIRERTFGSRFAGYAECAQCQERLEFTFDADDIRVGASLAARIEHVQQLTVDGYEVQAHLPNSSDLRAITSCRNVILARRLLLLRCILHASRNGDVVETESLPEQVVVAIGEQMVERDPQAEVQLGLTCPACQHCWLVTFDVVTFLWNEIQVHSKRVLRDVHTLAKAYGWHEADILAMSTVRRQFYLEMVS